MARIGAETHPRSGIDTREWVRRERSEEACSSLVKRRRKSVRAFFRVVRGMKAVASRKSVRSWTEHGGEAGGKKAGEWEERKEEKRGWIFSNGINVLLITRPERTICFSSRGICDQGISGHVLLRDGNFDVEDSEGVGKKRTNVWACCKDKETKRTRAKDRKRARKKGTKKNKRKMIVLEKSKEDVLSPDFNACLI